MSKEPLKRQAGYSDFTWLKQQATDKTTLQLVERIEQDEIAFMERGIITQGTEEFELHFKQGTFFTTRATSHSIANIFVHIFKNQEHMLASGFDVIEAPTIIDVGANEGYYAICMAQNNPQARIIAVEPNPTAYNLLVKNIQANNIKNITAINAAIWSKEGTVELCTLPQVTSIGSIIPIDSSFMTSSKERIVKVSVHAVPLSSIIEEYQLDRVDLLKIDIEGGELEVLRSSLDVLGVVDRIVLEYHSQQLRLDLTKLLNKSNFTLKMHAQDRADFGDLYFTKYGIEPNVAASKPLPAVIHSLYKKAKSVIISI